MKKNVISFLIIGVTVSLGIIGSKYFNEDDNLNSDKALISYYVETGEGTGVYEKQEGTTWPEGYVFNKEKSSCDNGSTLSWDSETNSVVVTANKGDSCKIYMDFSVERDLIVIYDMSANLYLNNVKISDANIKYHVGDILKYEQVSSHGGGCGLRIYNGDVLLTTIVGGYSFEYITEEYVFTGQETKIEVYHFGAPDVMM